MTLHRSTNMNNIMLRISFSLEILTWTWLRTNSPYLLLQSFFDIFTVPFTYFLCSIEVRWRQWWRPLIHICRKYGYTSRVVPCLDAVLVYYVLFNLLIDILVLFLLLCRQSFHDLVLFCTAISHICSGRGGQRGEGAIESIVVFLLVLLVVN